ncbi:MAG: tetratricopeptide repeat protein [Thermoanaerobaculia bacterium]|nr:tetratricopeptide repeat protein [Thermoanaerobaculia bacterium]
MTDSIPKRLFVPEPFVWYFFDLVIDVDRGTYDLRVFEEGTEAAFIDLHDQPNAASQPGSAVDKYSFIGDRGEDVSKVLYYVDDVVIATEEPAKLAPFVAPGRRSFFVTRWGAPPLEPEENPDSPLAHERAADAAFLAGRPGEAIAIYESLLEGSARRTILELKLADAYYKAGDKEAERRLREAIYGRLEGE